jgi:DNA repair protein RecO (recombination protein O)
MPNYKARAIVLKTYRLGENDKIIKLYSFEKGIISAVAKGVLKPKSRFGARLELYNILDLEITSGRSIDIISQTEIIGSFKNISSDFYKYSFSQIIADIILKTQSEDLYSNNLFKLLYVVLKKIDDLVLEDIRSLEKITSFFIAKLLILMGYAPILSNCGMCSSEISINEKNLYFSITMGSAICQQCSYNNKTGYVLNYQSYHYLKKLFEVQIKELESLEIEDKMLVRILNILGNYLIYHADAKIECLNYLKKININ